jgi:hypothetical protein
MARITLDLDHREQAPPWWVRAALAWGRRRYGQDPETVLAMSHHPGVLIPWALMETAGLRRRSVLPDGLADLVVLVTAVHIGCSALAPLRPGIGDHVLGIGPARREPVRNAVQVRPQLREDRGRFLWAHSPASSPPDDAALSTVTQQVSPPTVHLDRGAAAAPGRQLCHCAAGNLLANLRAGRVDLPAAAPGVPIVRASSAPADPYRGRGLPSQMRAASQPLVRYTDAARVRSCSRARRHEKTPALRPSERGEPCATPRGRFAAFRGLQ